MRRLATLALALLLAVGLYATAGAQSGPQVPPAGTIVVVAGISDGTSFSPLPGGIAIPPVGCAP